MPKVTIGVDFGTLAARAVVADVRDGSILASAVHAYAHGVMERALPGGRALPPGWALQHPADYLEALERTVARALRESGARAQDVIGIGTDFTSCTALPVRGDGTPLCLLPAFKEHPHAYVKLWKHHAAQPYADRMNALARERGEGWLPRYGGRISSESCLPKLWQVAAEAPEVLDAMDCWIEAADWIVWQMTGRRTRNACSAGYKALYSKRDGYPSEAFLQAADPVLSQAAREKAFGPVSALGDRAGVLTREMAGRLGLRPGTAVCTGNVDAHVCVPAAGIVGPGKLLAIMGTSTCHMLLSPLAVPVPGISGMVEDGILPGCYGYEAGQSCVGDHFAWVTQHLCPQAYAERAKAEGVDLHQLLTALAGRLRPGESGLLALDWWNGNRSILSDADLTGLLVGMTLGTRVEEIYRALIEATAYGTRVIVHQYKKNGLAVDAYYASGGISRKNALAMQIYADVLNMPVHVVGAEHGPALGSAIFAAVAAGSASGGYADIYEAAGRMGDRAARIFEPVAEDARVYDALFEQYRLLHDRFGRDWDVMKRLKEIQTGCVEREEAR